MAETIPTITRVTSNCWKKDWERRLRFLLPAIYTITAVMSLKIKLHRRLPQGVAVHFCIPRTSDVAVRAWTCSPKKGFRKKTVNLLFKGAFHQQTIRVDSAGATSSFLISRETRVRVLD